MPYAAIPYSPSDPIEVNEVRLTLELIGSNDSYILREDRLAVEVIGGNDSYGMGLTRYTAEVIGANDAINAEVTRYVAEVIGSYDFSLPMFSLENTRFVAEAIGNAATVSTKLTAISRFVSEVLGDAQPQHRALAVDDLLVPADTHMTLFVVLDSDQFSTGGAFTMHDALGDGLTVYGDSSSITIRWADGLSSVQKTLSTPAGAFLLELRLKDTPATSEIWVNGTQQTVTSSGTSYSDKHLLEIGGDRDVDHPHGAVLLELMVWPRVLTDPEMLQVRNTLTAKWL